MAVSGPELDRIESRLRHLDESVAALRSLQPLSQGRLVAEPLLRPATERLLYLCVQDVLDIGALLLRARAVRSAETYRDVITLLGETGVLDRTFAARIEPMASFRNVLEHGYVELDRALLVDYAGRADDFVEFAKQVAAFLGH
jgi:uncharacterized protein YutE (UPF0331/DUF86 family)